MTACSARGGASGTGAPSPIAASRRTSRETTAGGPTCCSTATTFRPVGRGPGCRTSRRQNCSRCWSRTSRVLGGSGSSKRSSVGAAAAGSQWFQRRARTKAADRPRPPHDFRHYAMPQQLTRKGRNVLVAVTVIALALQAIKLVSRVVLLDRPPTAGQWGQVALVVGVMVSL